MMLEVGETILARPADGYTITADDVAVFSYVPTEAQSNGNAVIGNIHKDASGNVVVDVMYKVTLSGGKDIVYTASVVTKDENEAEVLTPIDGEEFLALEGEETTIEFTLNEEFEPEEGFTVTVNDNEIVPTIIEETDGEGNVTRKFRVTFSADDETEIIPNISKLLWIGSHGAEMYGTSLTLEGRVSVNFYLDIGTYIQMYWFAAHQPHNSVYVKINDDILYFDDRVELTEHHTPGYVSTYRFSYDVAAKELNDPITFQLFVGDTPCRIQYRDDDGHYHEEYVYNYKASDYISKSLNGAGSDQLRPLVQALSDYGSYAQAYFGYHTDAMAAVSGNAETNTDAIDNALANYACGTNGSVDGLTYYGSSLILESETTLRHYFTLADGASIGDYTFTVDGKPATAKQKGSYWIIDIENIAAKDLHVMHTVCVTKGQEIFTLSYSALSYAYKGTQTNKQTLQNLSRALYLYNQAAITYFNWKNGGANND